MSKIAKFMAILLIVAILLTCVAPTIHAVAGTYRYTSNENSNIQETDEFLYRDDCFERSSFLGCSHLEALSAQVAIASASCYGDNVDKNEIDFTNNSANIVKMLKDMGFEDVATNKYYKLEKAENSAGVAVAHRTITVNDKEYTLLAIIPRSAGYRQEWAGNFTVGDGDIHEGFKAARDESLRYVKKYINDFNIQGDIKVWTAGHSRGAAIANMLGAFFAGGGIDYFDGKVSITPEDVYCYTYATPKSIKGGASKNNELSVAGNRSDPNYANDTPGAPFNYTQGGQVDLNSEVYRGIRNFILPSDLFPKLPPEAWGFARYGQDISVDHGKVTEQDMLKELKFVSEYAYNEYISGGSPNSFERKTFDLKTLSTVKDEETYSAMDFPTFVNERMNGLVHNSPTNQIYKDDGYQDALKSLAGIYGMTTPLFEESMLEDTGPITGPLLYSYLAYASERLQSEGKASTEHEAVAMALDELLTHYTGEEIDPETFTVDEFMILFTKYVSDNENEPIADWVVSGIAGLVPEEYQFILDAFKVFVPASDDGHEITKEESLKAYIRACYYGPEQTSEAVEYYETPERTRALLYTLVAFALYSEHPEIQSVVMNDEGEIDGSGKFSDFIAIVIDIMKTEKNESGEVDYVYPTLADLADTRLRQATDTILNEPLEKSGVLYGTKYKSELQGHIDNFKDHISQFRNLLIYALTYEDGDFNAVNSLNNLTTFMGNSSIVPLAHYNEVYVAYAKAASNYDCGYEDHDIHYEVVEGDNQLVNVADGYKLSFKFNIARDALVREGRVYVDGMLVTPDNYTVGEDGVITFNEAFVKTITPGKHRLKVATDRGYVNSEFLIYDPYVEIPASEDDSSISEDDPNNPHTGDIIGRSIWTGIIATIALAAAINIKFKRRLK